MDRRDIEHRFKYHQPPNKQTGDTHGLIRTKCLTLAMLIDEVTPDSREKSLAITSLEETMMWANAAIARNGLTDDHVV